MYRASVPIIPHLEASKSSGREEQIASIAARLITNEPTLGATEVFGRRVESGMSDGLALLVGDHREIALSTPLAAALHEYRISNLAADGDVLLLSGHRDFDFEAYRRDVLGLGVMKVLELAAPDNKAWTPLAERCRADPDVFRHVVELARRSGRLTVLPHIGSGSAWTLAGAVSDEAAVPVRVAAPPPRLSRAVNDKIWFARRVTELLGERAQPKLHAAYGPAALAAHVMRLGRQADRVVIKVPDSAGSAGNISLLSENVTGRSLPSLRAYLLALLAGVGWRDRYPLLVQIWDSDVISSPSVQLWIPREEDGPPQIEGIFEQIVSGPTGEFVGSMPFEPPAPCLNAIVREAFQLAALFQSLGYYGRCSLDAVIAGPDYQTAVLHWIECNGRWGGVSIPMTLANRLVGDWRRQSFIVVQLSHLRFDPRSLSECLELLDEDLYRADKPDEGVIILSPLGVRLGRTVNLMAIAATPERAQMLAQRSVDRLIGQE